MLKRFWTERALPAVKEQLRQGATPDGIALAAAVGLTLSFFPLVGATTALCLAAGLLFKLNQPILQLANYAGTPAQLCLLVPYWKAGSALIGVEAALEPEKLRAVMASGWSAAAATYGWTFAGGALAWAITAPILVGALYAALRPVFRRLV